MGTGPAVDLLVGSGAGGTAVTFTYPLDLALTKLAFQRTRDLDTIDLLEHLPALQQLLFRVLGCQTQVAAVYNFVIQLALSMVAGESIKIYNAISDGVLNRMTIEVEKIIGRGSGKL
ncbi:hypothetical protein MKW98_028858 [Papaver atlanticum]|uniref:AP180 N-terminal homology (ANTH) domain-containing protein n=1 Tax=Papaver atlanticum TaxID=357466 RepID=A0AAD4S2R8_9MAGN|nr:hypothetical protein MKW98_028858 [Papaver atlanticum]